VAISDVPGATTYWWVATLASLFASLSGGSGTPGPIPVSVRVGGRKGVTNGAGVTPASYDGQTLTPPKLAGTFLAKKAGRHVTILVNLSANLLGFGLGNIATAKLHVLR
jgi:hypothetical protein